MKKYIELKFDKMSHYWHPEHGQGVRTDGQRDDSCQSYFIHDLDVRLEVENENKIQSTVLGHLKKIGFPDDYLYLIDDRIGFNCIEDSEGRVLDSKTSKRKHEEGEQLFICDYSIYVSIVTIHRPDNSELESIFPMADK